MADTPTPTRTPTEVLALRQAWLDGYMGRCMVENGTVTRGGMRGAGARPAVLPGELAKIDGVQIGTLSAHFVAGDPVFQAVTLRYPMPTVNRPRVVPDPDQQGWEYCCLDGRIVRRKTSRDEPWVYASDYVTPARVAVWADLYANPTEEVDADA